MSSVPCLNKLHAKITLQVLNHGAEQEVCKLHLKNLWPDVEIKRLSGLVKYRRRHPTFPSDDKTKLAQFHPDIKHLIVKQICVPSAPLQTVHAEPIWSPVVYWRPSLGCLDKVPWPSNSSKETDLGAVQLKNGPDHLQPELSQSPLN